MVAADGLCKREVFRLPDPFVVITADGEQTCSSSVIKKTLNPYWNESFIFLVRNESVFTIQVFDQRKWKKDENQGFLGVVNILMSSVFNIETDGDEILTLDLKKSNSGEYVCGKIVIALTVHGVGEDGSEAPHASISPRASAGLGTTVANHRPVASQSHSPLPKQRNSHDSNRGNAGSSSSSRMTPFEDDLGPLPEG